MTMKKALISLALLAFSSVSYSGITVYYDPANNLQAEADYLAALAAYATITESFEDDAVWVRSPNSTPSTTSQGLIWESNFTNSTTGAMGGSVADETYGFFSIPHGNTTDTGLFQCDEFNGETASFNDPCWQGDGWIVTSAKGETLYGIGGWINDSGIAKVTFLLDGINVNMDRDGEFISGWTFVGVIDTSGFTSAEIRELRGTDADQKFIFGDRFSIGVTEVPVPDIDTDGDGIPDSIDTDDDNDGLTDDAEINTYKTNPIDADTDNDGLNDGYEITEGFNPLNNSDCPDWICIGSSRRGWRLGLGL
jgi:hypothetical protein